MCTFSKENTLTYSVGDQAFIIYGNGMRSVLLFFWSTVPQILKRGVLHPEWKAVQAVKEENQNICFLVWSLVLICRGRKFSQGMVFLSGSHFPLFGLSPELRCIWESTCESRGFKKAVCNGQQPPRGVE